MQAVAEKLYPKDLNFRDFPSTDWVVSSGTATYTPLVLTTPGTTSEYRNATAQTRQTYDFSMVSTLNVSVSSGAVSVDMVVYLLDENDNEVAHWGWNTSNEGNTKAFNVSNYNGNYKVKVLCGTNGNKAVAFNTLNAQ